MRKARFVVATAVLLSMWCCVAGGRRSWRFDSLPPKYFSIHLHHIQQPYTQNFTTLHNSPPHHPTKGQQLNNIVRGELPIYACNLFHPSLCIMLGLTYLLTPWSRVLLKKLTGLQLVKKFPAFYGTQKFITALTSVRHLSLSWASPIQSTYPHPTSWRSILILPTHLRLGLPNGLFPSGFPTKTLYTPLSSPILATC